MADTCAHCGGTDLREQQATIELGNAGTQPVVVRGCATCGAAVLDVQIDQHTIAGWPRASAAATGQTTRLQPPAPDLAPRTRCPACGSHHLIPERPIIDQGQVMRDLSIHIDGDPYALLFRKTAMSKLQAWICSECGYVSLFVSDPDKLYDAYQRAKIPPWLRNL